MRDTNQRFREVVDELAQLRGWTVAAVVRLGVKHGLTSDWTRERYYQRAAVQQGDVAKLELLRVHLLSDAELDDNDAKSSARYYQERIQELSWNVELSRAAVAKMCMECANPDDDEDAECWSGACPLRKLSPLPLRAKEERRP